MYLLDYYAAMQCVGTWVVDMNTHTIILIYKFTSLLIFLPMAISTRMVYIKFG